jgi:hypothetical protein
MAKVLRVFDLVPEPLYLMFEHRVGQDEALCNTLPICP